jgi:hypothetical protein
MRDGCAPLLEQGTALFAIHAADACLYLTVGDLHFDWAHSSRGCGFPCSDDCRWHWERPLKRTTSRAATAPAAKLGDNQMMFFMHFS